MPQVNVMVNQRAYTIACAEGEEEHLRELAAHVDAKVGELLGSVGQVGEPRLLLLAALVISDEYFESMALLDKRAREVGELSGARDLFHTQLAATEQNAAVAIEAAAKRVEDIAAGLAEA